MVVSHSPACLTSGSAQAAVADAAHRATANVADFSIVQTSIELRDTTTVRPTACRYYATLAVRRGGFMRNVWFRLSSVAAFALSIYALATTASFAQSWPTHPVRLVLPFGPGSG